MSCDGDTAEVDTDYQSSEYANSDELRSLCTTDEEGEFTRWDSKENSRPQFNMESDLQDPRFEVGMRYKSAPDVRNAIRAYAIKNRRAVVLKKNDKLRIRAVCKGNTGCQWALQVGWSDFEKEWEIRTYNGEHMCNKIRIIKYATAEWLAKQHMEHIRENPEQSVQAFRTHVATINGIDISMGQAYRARKIAQDLIYGNHEEQYALLRNYLGEVMRANPGSTIKLEFEEYNDDDPTRQFKRVYACLGALKNGFNAGCRKILGFDGAFLKGPYPGQLLSAIGNDADNGMYPVAYAVVEAENKNAWTWVLELVIDDLQITNQQHWIFISDEQKCLVPAIAELLPGIEHRWCLQHINSNYKKEHRGLALKEALFKTARATNIQYFNIVAKEFEKKYLNAYQWAFGKDPKHWCKSFWTTAVKSDISMNNLWGE